MKKHNNTTFSIKTAAKMARFPGGEKKFAAWLRAKGFLMPNNEPYQAYCNRGWFILTSKTIHKANPPFTVAVTRITIRGLSKLEELVYNEFLKCKNHP